MTLRDALGHAHQPVAPQGVPRIMSLVPSITKLLRELGPTASRYLRQLAG